MSKVKYFRYRLKLGKHIISDRPGKSLVTAFRRDCFDIIISITVDLKRLPEKKLLARESAS